MEQTETWIILDLCMLKKLNALQLITKENHFTSAKKVTIIEFLHCYVNVKVIINGDREQVWH